MATTKRSALLARHLSPLILAIGVCAAPDLYAQARGGQGAQAPSLSAKAAAPIDLSGYWVSIISEDWRWRMVTPAKGDYASIPITAAAKKVADAWDPAKDEAASEQCKPYGAAAIMRVPGRLRISWQDDNTLKVETDAGMQTRLLHFGRQAPAGQTTWQGDSVGSWEVPRPGRGGGQASPSKFGHLKVVTTRMRPGYLRKNGVPYSGEAVLTEHWELHRAPNAQWLVVTSLVSDPQYLQGDFVTSSNFKKETDGSNGIPHLAPRCGNAIEPAFAHMNRAELRPARTNGMRLDTLTMTVLVATVLAAAPAFAQVDLSGNWAVRNHEDWMERAPGPDPVDYLGLPINEEGRSRALTYTAAAISQPDRQCLYYPPHYVVIGPQGFKIWSESDPATGRTIAWKIAGVIDRAPITIWMDGRPRPSQSAPHTFAGFTTGVWEGDTLTSYTTHIKEGFLRRNGVPTSDQTTFNLFITRYGGTLTITAVIDDPIYLSEPHILSRNWQLDPTVEMPPTPDPCVPEVEVPQGEGAVAHLLPGRNPFVDEVTKIYNIPLEAVMGGAHTMYPEYRKTLKGTYVAPAICVRYCCGGGTTTGLGCITGGGR